MIVWPFQRKRILESDGKNHRYILILPLGTLHVLDCPTGPGGTISADLSNANLRLLKFSRLILHSKAK